MWAASSRYKLALFVTAGWDSRLLLAASRKITGQISTYSMMLDHMTEKSPDVTIPRSISRTDQRLNWHLLDCRTRVDPEFHSLYHANVNLAHESSIKPAYTVFGKIPQDRLSVKGNCSEIARCGYYMYGVHDEIVSARQLAALVSGWDEIPFVVEYLDDWLLEAERACAEAGMELLDLFFWEHYLGSWLARTWLEKDIAEESFSPYNYRPLITVMLGAPLKYRRGPDYLLYQFITERLWPKLVQWPVNPRDLSFGETVELHIRKFLLHTGLYARMRRLYKFIGRFIRPENMPPFTYTWLFEVLVLFSSMILMEVTEW